MNNTVLTHHRQHQFSTINNSNTPYKKTRLVLFLVIIFSVLFYWFYQQKELVQTTKQYISTPKIDDIYYLDFRLFTDKLRPKEKFRLAKIVDITGDVATLVYGNFFYTNHKSMYDSIRYGHLRYKKYFEGRRYNFSFKQLLAMQESNAIFAVERPTNDKLHGNFIKPVKFTISRKHSRTLFIAGKKENISGESYLKASNIANHFNIAFDYFKQSAQLNYPQGQINLAQMYLSTQLEQQNFTAALYWFKQAALQSNKAAINKYTIVCDQLEHCDINHFYQDLINAGVNIRFNRATMPKFSLN